MGRAIHLVASGEPAWAGAVLRVPRRCMGRLRGFGTTGAALFLWRELPTPELSMNEYKVGYKKPPKEHQFKPKHQTAVRPKDGKRKENSPDVAGWLDKPLKVKR